MDKIGKKDLIQILGIGILLIFLILPSYWLSEFLLYTSLYSFLGNFYIYLFPCCFLLLGIIQGLLWQNKRIGYLPVSLWIIVAAMLSCFLMYQWISKVWSGLLIFAGVLIIHGLLSWVGFRLAYYGDKTEK